MSGSIRRRAATLTSPRLNFVLLQLIDLDLTQTEALALALALISAKANPTEPEPGSKIKPKTTGVLSRDQTSSVLREPLATRLAKNKSYTQS